MVGGVPVSRRGRVTAVATAACGDHGRVSGDPNPPQGDVWSAGAVTFACGSSDGSLTMVTGNAGRPFGDRSLALLRLPSVHRSDVSAIAVAGRGAHGNNPVVTVVSGDATGGIVLTVVDLSDHGGGVVSSLAVNDPAGDASDGVGPSPRKRRPITALETLAGTTHVAAGLNDGPQFYVV